MIWQSGGSNPSPYYSSRFSFYGLSGVPQAMFGGTGNVIGGISGGSMYSYYLPQYNQIINYDSPLDISMDMELNGYQLTVTADVTVTGPITTTNNKILLILTRKVNADWFCTVERYSDEPFYLTSIGQTETFEHTFTIDASWNIELIKAIAVVQTWNNDPYVNRHRVLQACQTDINDFHADFSADPTSGMAPLTVNFFDQSTQPPLPIVTWEWDFDNDGIIDSHEQNPIYTYHEQGVYTVSLTVASFGGFYTDTKVKEDYITVLQPPPTQIFNLNEQWNWISFYIHPDDCSIPVVFEPLTNIPDIYQIKNQNQSATYEPDWLMWLGDLTEITDGEAYLIDMINSYDEFNITGSFIDPQTPIDLVVDWNWIAYYPDYVLPIAEAMSSIEPLAYQIKNQTQSATYSSVWGWFGNLTEMEPGIGYKLCMLDEATLIYVTPLPIQSKTYNVEDAESVIPGTEFNIVLMAQVTVNNELFTGSEYTKIIAYGPGGETDYRAVGTWIEGPNLWYFTIVGNENGDEIRFKLYNNDIVYDCNETIIFEDNKTIGNPQNPYQIENTSEIQKATKLNSNFPNPFRNSTTISFSLREKSPVKLSIHNIKGELVTTLIDEEMNHASNNQIIWDGKVGDKKLANGIYFYKLDYGINSEIKQMVILK